MSQGILVCEDDKEITEFLDLYLSMKGYDYTIVNRGEHVLPELEKKYYDLLLLDLGLPDLPGEEIVKIIRKEHIAPDMSIVYFSASFRLEKAMEDVPVDGILHKPFDITQLDNILKKFTELNNAI